jgi:dolichol kinase
MEPVTQNIVVMLATFVYIKVVVGVCDWLVEKRIVSLIISRKTVHIAASFWCLFWPHFTTVHKTWCLNVGAPVVYALQLLYKALILRDPNDPDVKTMSRTGRPIELLYGPLLFIIVMVYCGLFQFQTEAGIYIMAAMGFGDGLAPVFGTYFPVGRYRSLLTGDYKTATGSLGMFVGTVLGIHILRAGTGVPEFLSTGTVLGVALVATIAEAVAGKWDNFVIALAVYAFIEGTTVTFD